MKILKFVLPIILFILILFLYLDKSNLFKFQSSTIHKNISVYTPKITFIDHIGSIVSISNFQELFPQFSNNDIYLSSSYISPYTIANDLGFSSPPIVSNSNSVAWSSGSVNFSYSNNTYFYNSGKDYISSSVNPYIFLKNILIQDFGMISVKFKYSENISNSFIEIKAFPVINGNYIYDSSGRYYEDFSFYSNGEIKSFTIEPLYLTTKYGKLVNVKLNTSNVTKFGSSVNLSFVNVLSLLNVSSVYYIDSTDSVVFPIYLISANADIINQGLVPISLYVPEVKFR